MDTYLKSTYLFLAMWIPVSYIERTMSRLKTRGLPDDDVNDPCGVQNSDTQQSAIPSWPGDDQWHQGPSTGWNEGGFETYESEPDNLGN